MDKAKPKLSRPVQPKSVSTGYSRHDKETTASYDYLSKTWIVYSSVPGDITRMMKLYGDKVEVLEYLDNEFKAPVLVRCEIPKSALGFRKIATQEQRDRQSERAKRNFHGK